MQLCRKEQEGTFDFDEFFLGLKKLVILRGAPVKKTPCMLRYILELTRTHGIDNTNGIDKDSWYSPIIGKDSWYIHGLAVLPRTYGIDMDSWN